MTDIVERLRSPEFADVAAKYLMAEAAEEIERLRDAIHGLEQHLATAHNEALGNLNRLSGEPTP